MLFSALSARSAVRFIFALDSHIPLVLHFRSLIFTMLFRKGGKFMAKEIAAPVVSDAWMRLLLEG